ncbi:hypothetical protein Q9L58_007289 [Maublancomyces gigas]|uniref:Uncharacterized protein n=1 Tax=Discina gigas TaxID=1032678 RepID=A0ABR3GDZ9_9PEZI
MPSMIELKFPCPAVEVGTPEDYEGYEALAGRLGKNGKGCVADEPRDGNKNEDPTTLHWDIFLDEVILLPDPVPNQAEEDSFWLTFLGLFGLEDNTPGGHSPDAKVTFQLSAYLDEFNNCNRSA